MNQHIGIVGCSAPGAALCYQTICTQGSDSERSITPEVSMHTHPFCEYLRHINHSDWQSVAGLLLSSADKLARLGADFCIAPCNTVHLAFEFVRSRSPLPWLHIAEEVARLFSQQRKMSQAKSNHRPSFLKPCQIPDVSGEAYCGRYEVFENRETKKGRTISLNIQLLPAINSSPAPDPLFFLAGGPGGPATSLTSFAADVFAKVRNERAIVLIDQRGTGNSNPLTCNLYGDTLGGHLPDSLHVVFRYGGHSYAGFGSCTSNLMTEFISQGTTKDLTLLVSPNFLKFHSEFRVSRQI